MTNPDWDEPHRLKELADKQFEQVPEQPGTYRVYQEERPVPRAFDTDGSGTLSIGESINLRQRLRRFWLCAQGKHQRGHAAGWKYRDFCFECRFPLKELHVQWVTASSKTTARNRESDEMREYLKQFGELPPLNYQFTKRYTR
ncbi:MAG: hypothetical protein R6V05_10245 [Candidatus Brocadiia bacterium]